MAFVFPAAPASKHVRSKMTCSLTTPAVTPILVTDILDTLVVDPFFNGMEKHFGFLKFDEFLKAKTPDLWVQFEMGKVDEEEVAQNFFRDGRRVDMPAFKQYLKQSYKLLPGTASMLTSLRNAGIEIHACSNYPIWSDLIEDTLQLRQNFGLNWTFVSGREGLRKPDKRAYMRVAEKAKVDVSSCILLDDRKANCDGALDAGFLGAVHFQNSQQAMRELETLYAGCDIAVDFNTSEC